MDTTGWREFRIERIKILKGRTVGSLTKAELCGLKVWLDRVAERWGSVDDDIKRHYQAIYKAVRCARAHLSNQSWWSLYRNFKN